MPSFTLICSYQPTYPLAFAFLLSLVYFGCYFNCKFTKLKMTFLNCFVQLFYVNRLSTHFLPYFFFFKSICKHMYIFKKMELLFTHFCSHLYQMIIDELVIQRLYKGLLQTFHNRSSYRLATSTSSIFKLKFFFYCLAKLKFICFLIIRSRYQ